MTLTPSNDDLRVFVAVARKSSFSAAAAELGVSPAYVTKRIRVLEQTLATRLFHRTTRRVVKITAPAVGAAGLVTGIAVGTVAARRALRD